MRCILKNSSLLLILFFPGMLSAQFQRSSTLDVSPSGHSVVIRWEIPAMDDSFYYYVERSADSIYWKEFGSTAKNSSHRYSIVDSNPGEGKVYYRIRQVTEHHVSLWSMPKWIQINRADEVYIWPNPTSNVLHVKTPFNKGNMEISDPGGKLVMRVEIINYISDIITEKLSKGIYFIRIRAGGKIITVKFIKT